MSGPTRIRFCAKNQENQHDDPETPKKLHPERDPNSKPLALRARGFQALKLALRARFRAQTTSLRSASGLTLGRENAKKKCQFSNILLERIRPLNNLPPIFEFFRTRFERLVKKYVVYSQTEFQKQGLNLEIFTLL